MKYEEVTGDLIALAKQGKFNVIAHGCNCFCTMGNGIAPKMNDAFAVGQYQMERPFDKGKITKLGNIDFGSTYLHPDGRMVVYTNHMLSKALENQGWKLLEVVNCYTQYTFGRQRRELIYPALELCLIKMNSIFHGKHIGLPQIGCGLAGGNWDYVKKMIQERMTLCDVTVVIYDK